MSAITRVRDERKRTWYWVDDEFIDLHARHLTQAAQCLYQFYARHADRAGFSNFSRKDKAEILGFSETTIRNADKELTNKGYIRIKRQMRDNGSQSNNHVYVLPLGSQLPQVAPGQNMVGGQNPHPLKESSVVVSSQPFSESESGNTTTEIPLRGSNSEEGSNSDPPPPTETVPDEAQTADADEPAALVEALLASWCDCGIEGDYLRALAESIGQRPDGANESDDILDYREAWNQYAAADRRLGPGWVVVQLKTLAVMSRNTPRTFRWMNHAPPKAAKPEYWRKYTAEADPWAAQDSRPDSLLNQLLRPGATTAGEERAA